MECRRAIHRGGGEPFRTRKGVGGPKSYDSAESLVLFIQYSLYFTRTILPVLITGAVGDGGTPKAECVRYLCH
jgi:hypothetical protein